MFPRKRRRSAIAASSRSFQVALTTEFGHKQSSENAQEYIRPSAFLGLVTPVASIVGEGGKEMGKQCKYYLTVLLCVAIAGNSACGTATHRIGSSQAAMSHHGIGNGDYVLVRYANKNDRRSSSSSELVQITNISHTGLSGVAENGNVINVGYDEIFQIEYKKRGVKNLDEMPRLKSALTVASAMLVVPAIALGQ
jgi:hypothetical protein